MEEISGKVERAEVIVKRTQNFVDEITNKCSFLSVILIFKQIQQKRP